MNRLLLILLMTMGIAGCQSPDYGNGIDVDVYPVTYQFSVLTAEPVQKADDAWQQFRNRHSQEILSNQIDFYYADKYGEKKARLWRQQLIDQGADVTRLTLHSDRDLNRFDLQVRMKVYKVVTPLCRQPEVGHFYQTSSGCFVDSALWHSMAHPEKALPEKQ